MKEFFFRLDGADVYLAQPEETHGPWVMGIHGSGRDALGYRDVPFYARQRDLALENGCAFCAISMGQDVWAKPHGMVLLEQLYTEMSGRGFWRKCILMASSAGGCQMFRFAQLHSAWIAALIGIFPVWDVEKIALPSLERAWGLSDDALREALKERNPARFLSALPDVPVVVCHGLADTAVPVSEHTLCLAQRFPIQLHLTREAHSTQSLGLYETPLIAHAMRQYVVREE